MPERTANGKTTNTSVRGREQQCVGVSKTARDKTLVKLTETAVENCCWVTPKNALKFFPFSIDFYARAWCLY